MKTIDGYEVYTTTPMMSKACPQCSHEYTEGKKYTPSPDHNLCWCNNCNYQWLEIVHDKERDGTGGSISWD